MTPPKYTTSCRHCGKQTPPAFSFGVPIVGETVPDRLAKFIEALLTHVQQHPEVWAQLTGSIGNFTGLMVMNQFDTADPGLNARADAIRADVHRRTRKHFITDAAITDLVSRIGLDPDQEKAVAALMRGMRDAYEEQGEFSPEKQAARPLVTA